MILPFFSSKTKEILLFINPFLILFSNKTVDKLNLYKLIKFKKFFILFFLVIISKLLILYFFSKNELISIFRLISDNSNLLSCIYKFVSFVFVTICFVFKSKRRLTSFNSTFNLGSTCFILFKINTLNLVVLTSGYLLYFNLLPVN